MFFIILWMLCLDCSAASFLPKVHSVELMPLDTEDQQDPDFKQHVAQGYIPLGEIEMKSFLEYARSKNLNMEEKIKYYLNYIKTMKNNFIDNNTKNIEALKNIASGLLYDQGRYDCLKNKIERQLKADCSYFTDQDRMYCKNLIIVLDFLISQGCQLFCDIKAIIPTQCKKLKPAYYEFHLFNVFDLIEDTLPFKRKLLPCALM